MIITYNKLVRDRIPEIIESSGKSGIYRVYEAKILVFPVISTKNRSCWTARIRQELFFCLITSKNLGTFWCKTALHNARLK